MLHGERDLQSEPQLMISGSYPARGALSACESTRVVIRHSGWLAERAGWQESGALRRAEAPSDHWRRLAASRRCTSLVDRRGCELGGGSRLSSAEAAAATGGGGRQVTEGFSRAARQAERPTASSPHLVVFSWWRHGTAAPRA